MVMVTMNHTTTAASIIPDTPIVSIAGSTLSEITTTTTSTKTTPTPVPTSNDYNKSKNSSKPKEKIRRSASSDADISGGIDSASSSPALLKSSAISSNLMSDTNPSCAATAADYDSSKQILNTTTIENSPPLIKLINTTTNSCPININRKNLSTTLHNIQTTENDLNDENLLPSKSVVINSACTIISKKAKSKESLSESWEECRLKDWDDNQLKELLEEAYHYKNPRDKENKSKAFLQLLEKAENEDPSYPFGVITPRPLSNLITSNNYYSYQQENAQHHIAHSSRNNSQNSSSSNNNNINNNNNNNNNHHHHTHHRSHHHPHKQGGSLQDLFNEAHLDCDQSFSNSGGATTGNQKTRRQNHNSRQKKYSTSVSSRQREGGSLPSNVNATYQLAGGVSSGGGGVHHSNSNDFTFLHEVNVSSKANKKEQRRSAKTNTTGSTTINNDTKENTDTIAPVSNSDSNVSGAANPVTAVAPNVGDCIIEIGEPIMDIQQQQQILQVKGQDAATQGVPYYENLVNLDRQIPRVNFVKTKCSSFAPTTYHCYVDESIRFDSLECGGATTRNAKSVKKNISGSCSDTVMGAVSVSASASAPPAAVMDTKYLPLDDNYKSCISVLGSNAGDNAPEKLCLKTKCITTYPKTLLPNIQPPVSPGTVLTGLAQQQQQQQLQLDENGNALSELYQSVANMGAGTTIHLGVTPPTSLANISTSATVTISAASHTASSSTSATIASALSGGPSQAKAKGKKKSLQERNTKTVDVESVAGYRGNDPVEELVKYIESGEGGTGGCGGNISKGADKKKDRRKDKDKHQKLKKSNSLEELRSGAKLDLQELKRSAATTETNAVVMRQKQGNNKNNKNSSSTADIHKSSDNNKCQSNNNAQLSTTTIPGSSKSDRRSWGNEDLKCLEEQQQQQHLNASIEDKSAAGSTNMNAAIKDRQKTKQTGKAIDDRDKERDNKEVAKDKISERNEKNSQSNSNAIIQHNHPTAAAVAENSEQKTGKLDKAETKTEIKAESREREKMDKRKKDITQNAVTIVDILAMESVLPETAEFHVVTKRKKPKKQRIVNSVEETTVTISRPQNFSMPKNSSSTIAVTTSSTIQAQGSGRCRNQTHDTVQQSAQTNTMQENRTNSGGRDKDKSRRKSTSSMPPSEKSDTSDEDSIHSLPPESTTKATTVVLAKVITSAVLPTTGTSLIAAGSSNPTTVTKLAQCKRNKSIKQQQFNTSSNTTLLTAKITTSPSAPISYADIARNKDINSTDSANEISNTSLDIVAINILGNAGNYGCISPAEDDAKGQNSASSSTSAKSHKIKRTQQKGDFPELGVSSTGTPNSTGPALVIENYEYPQKHAQNLANSLAVIGVAGNRLIEVVGGGSGVGNEDSTNEVTAVGPSTNINTKVHTTDVVKARDNIHTYQQQQHPQSAALQKSKGVDHDPFAHNLKPTTCNSNAANISTLGSGTYNNNTCSNSNMVTYQVTNLDQQYPALEKTVKRHNSNSSTTVSAAAAAVAYVPTQTHNSHLSHFSSSSNNVGFQTNVLVTATQAHLESSVYNFAAAAKQQQQQQQQQQIVVVGDNIESNSANGGFSNIKQLILTTSGSSSTRNNNDNSSISSNVNVVNNRKSKEKTPPADSITATSSSSAALLPSHSTMASAAAGISAISFATFSTNNIMHPSTTHQHLQDTNIIQNVPATTTTTITSLPSQIQILRRSKKDRQHQQQQSLPLRQQPQQISIYTVPTNNGRKLMVDSNSSNTCSNPQQYSMNRKSQLKSSSSLPTIGGGGSSSSCFGDDRQSCSIVSSTINTNRPAVIILNDDRCRRISNDIMFGDFDEEDRELLFQDQNAKEDYVAITSATATDADISEIAAAVPVTDADISDVSSGYLHDESLESQVSAEVSMDYLPQPSVHYLSQPSAISGHQFSDNAATAYTSSAPAASLHVQQYHMQQHQQQQYTPPPIDDNGFNNYANTVENNQNAMDGVMDAPPPQQLETCNEIESAILAAVRAQQHYHHHEQDQQQQTQHMHKQQEQQQLQFRNSKSSSNSSSFSSSATTSGNSNYDNNQIYDATPTTQNTFSAHNSRGNTHYSQRRRSLSGHSSRRSGGGGGSYRQIPPSSQQQCYDEDADNDEAPVVNATTGDSYKTNTSTHSAGRVCRITIGPYKEIHYLLTPGRPFTYNQHRRHDQLVDFISTSWDDIINSNGTQMYNDNNQ